MKRPRIRSDWGQIMTAMIFGTEVSEYRAPVCLADRIETEHGVWTLQAGPIAPAIGGNLKPFVSDLLDNALEGDGTMIRRLHLAAVLMMSVMAIAGSPTEAGETQTYSYDVQGHLVAVQYSGSINNGQADSICFDPADNRTRYVSSSSGVVASCISAPTPPQGGPPSFAISSSVYGYEQTNMIFAVTKTGGLSSSYSVTFATANGTALAGSDFSAASGTLTFGPSETTKYISIAILGGGGVEPLENYYVNIASPSGGSTITTSQGVGWIEDVSSGGGGGHGCQTC